MKRCVIILLLSLSYYFVLSQTSGPHSKKVELSNADKNANAIFHIGKYREYQGLNLDSVLAANDQALSHCRDSLAWVQLIRTRASLLVKHNKTDNIPELVSPAIQYAERRQMHSELVELYNLLGVFQTSRGEYSDAMRSYHKIIPLIYGDSIGKTRPDIFNNIGMLYYKIRDSKTAIRYYKEAISIGGKAETFLNIALAYSDQDSVEEGWTNVSKAEALMRSEGHSVQDSIMLHFVYGKLFF